MPVIENASKFTISGDAHLYEVHGNAVVNHPTETNERKRIQSIRNLPRAQASHKDYETWKKSGPCFPGTRQALLREMMDWITNPGESRMYILSGLAGIGKSTVAYTLATQAEEFSLLGASFFFSRDADNRDKRQGKLKVWDAATGIPISTILGHRFAVANDFSIITSSENKTITFYNINGGSKEHYVSNITEGRKIGFLV